MPCTLKVQVIAAKELPVMDRKSELTDAFVELRFADFDTERTGIARKTLNPVWGEEFTYDVSNGEDLQDEPLELRVLDYDTISANDTVGTVLVDLNPLLTSSTPHRLTGWFPIYDSLCGIRGSLHISVSLELFGRSDRFKNTPAGVNIFSVTGIPAGMGLKAIHGLVDARLIEDDPEFHWSDTFRTPRSSNDSRQKLFFRLAGRLRRTIGRKALEMGADAVIGYQEHFDLENVERVISAGAIACAVQLEWIDEAHRPPQSPTKSPTAEETLITDILDLGKDALHAHNPGIPPSPKGFSSQGDLSKGDASLNQPSSPSTTLDVPRSSEAFLLQPNTPNTPGRLSHSPSRPSIESPRTASIEGRDAALHRHSPTHPDTLSSPRPRIPEEHLLPLRSLPPGIILRIGGVVSSKSVKLIEDDESRTRENWWEEVREEVRTHARTLGCTHILGYGEWMTVNEDLCVLSASGTAVILDGAWLAPVRPGLDDLGNRHTRVRRSSNRPDLDPRAAEDRSLLGSGADEEDTKPARVVFEELADFIPDHNLHNSNRFLRPATPTPRESLNHLASEEPAPKARLHPPSPLTTPSRSHAAPLHTTPSFSGPTIAHTNQKVSPNCRLCHITFHRKNAPLPMVYKKCGRCRKHYVPEILLATIDPPAELDVLGDGRLVEARICRTKKNKEGESHAAIISETLPYVEYDLHRQLLLKLHLLGMNAIFGLRFQLTIGDDLLIAIATGTAYHIPSLPTPALLTLSRTFDVPDEADVQLKEFQERITTISTENRRLLRIPSHPLHSSSHPSFASTLPERSAYSDYGISNADSVHSIKPDDLSAHLPSPPLAADEESVTDSTSDEGGSSDEAPEDIPETSVVVRLENATDEDMMSVLLGEDFGLRMTNVERVGGRTLLRAPILFYNTIHTGEIRPFTKRPNSQLSSVYQSLYQPLRDSLPGGENFVIAGLSSSVAISGGLTFQVRMTAAVMSPDCASPSSPSEILITPLSSLPFPIDTHYGRIVLHFVKEEHIQSGQGAAGVHGFTHRFMSEVHSVLEAHIRGLGANGLVGYVMEQMECEDNSKGTAYAVISISGDAVHVARPSAPGHEDAPDLLPHPPHTA